MVKYTETRGDKVEVFYNLARALHYLGLNSNAMDLYERVIKLPMTNEGQ